MMDSVTVLNAYEGYIAGPGFSIGGLLFAIMGAICLIVSILCWVAWEESAFPLPLCAVACGIFAWILFATGNSHYQSYQKWDVLIDESVSLTEFNERYEILEQKGLIYTIRERTE